jgi:UDP-glucose 4-epimerase
MKFPYRQALVTGGAGFIGSHIVEALDGLGCRVRVLDNLSTGRIANLEPFKDRIHFKEGDIRNIDLLMESISDCDVIFHQAAIVSVPQSVEDPIGSASVNEAGTLKVLEAAHRCGVKRVVLASSCAVYGNNPQMPKTEDLPPSPESPYALQKWAGEQYARLFKKLYGIDTVCLRYFNVYGPRQDPSSPYSGVISIFMANAAEDRSPIIFGTGRQSRDFIFVKDVVKANLLAACIEQAGGSVFNAGTGRSVSIGRLWESILRISGCSAKPRYEAARAGDILESTAGTGLARKVLGFESDYSFERGLELTYRWYEKTT